MKKNTLTIFSFLIVFNVFAQNQTKVDSLLQALETNISEKEKVDTYNLLARQYSDSDSVQTSFYANQAIKIAKKINYNKGVIRSYDEIAWISMLLGNSEKAIDLHQKSIAIAKKIKYPEGEAGAYNGLGTVNNYLGNSTKALEYYFKALKIYEGLNEKLRISQSYYNIALTYRNQSDHDKSLEYHLKGLEIDKNLGDSSRISTDHSDIGFVYTEKGNYTKAMEHQLIALKIQERIKNEKLLTYTFHNVAMLYYKQKKYTQALEYSFKSLKIAKKLGWKGHIGNLYNTIATTYKEQDNFDQALEYNLKSLEIQKEIGEKQIIVASYVNIGKIHLLKEEYEKALEYLQKGLLFQQKIEDQSSHAVLLNTIGEVEWKLGNLQKAKEYLIQGVTIAQKINFPTAIRDGSEVLSGIQKALGNHKAALASYELYHSTYDSLLGEEKSKQLSLLQVQYETEKKEQEIKSLAQQASIQSLELKQANFNKTIFGIVSMVLLLLGLVLYLVNRQKRLALQQRAQDIEQNLLRVQMNPHFIFNAMTSIQDYMNQGDAKQASMYLIKFSKLIRQVLDNSRSEFISLDQEINMLDNYLSIQNLKRDHPFTFKIEVEDGLISEEIAIPPMFAQPFVENAIEHGVTAIKEGATIHIHFSMEGDHLVLKILDNGSGIEEAIKVKRKDHVSHAIKITEERIDLYRKMRKKKIAFDIQDLSQGTQVTFNLPFQYI
ncbi:tetratricopeptide (TPR) repeat protein [Aquimarina sp. EL_43]|uniref:tetratricopeptide repeat-containing sensor histidine kinase n=1 Tax=unclassified Aquimarina TaxID=2627091 RepID=UPI0018C9B708|nr:MULTISPECIES: tetratricopeptide repeat protein [unclassified Aquimarina]MBG6132536.1 tetratricopeptide (TPR) repeat protein [Aquimarina sp. EL_35]MBG6152667.1 tetratricopeptide (TPR) repeat protein [Aquimarina sp. EL_32]MBG6170674.1 tetratricopeptide (TPR) repeat protein [Aquimarina sp. EL_43]